MNLRLQIDGDLTKILWHDGIGLSLYAKRLDRGKFVWPSASGGAVSISAAQTDAVGNTGSSATVSVTVDVTAPSVSITSGPSDASTSNSASASFGFTSAASDLARFECELDGAGFGACGSSSPGSTTVSGLADGGHTFKVRAVDAAGNISTVATRSWTVDRTAPVVSVTSPAGGSTLGSATVVVTGVASEASSVSVTVRASLPPT